MKRSQRKTPSLIFECFMGLLVIAGTAQARQFAGSVTKYGKEQCIVLNRFSKDSGANYRSTDADKEAKLCGIDFNSKSMGLCPKTWSTSPGTIVYDISRSKYNGHPEAFEAEYCPQQKALKGKVEGVERLASYKQSINGQFNQRTSATFSQASPLYYHFSRYFNVTVDVPVAVMRTMDAREHNHRVTTKGLAIARGGMILNGWKVVNSAEKDPSGYVPVNEFYYGDPKDGLFYGTMLKGPGARYGAEFNGDIVGKGYSEQYVFLQQTPAFLALANPKDFPDAADAGLSESKRNRNVAKALGPGVSKEQMMFWMTEASDICLLDYIFGQQDRPGNIDHLWEWYYVDKQGRVNSIRVDSDVERNRMLSIHAPDEAKGSSRVLLIQKTQINDNDAGGRKYANFTKRFSLLEKIRHLNPVTYRQLIHLAKDFKARGPLYSYLQETFYLGDGYADLIAQNTVEAAQILQNTCKTGSMRFDLNPEAYLVTQKADDARLDCANP
jgi:hypothetical protein